MTELVKKRLFWILLTTTTIHYPFWKTTIPRPKDIRFIYLWTLRLSFLYLKNYIPMTKKKIGTPYDSQTKKPNTYYA